MSNPIDSDTIKYEYLFTKLISKENEVRVEIDNKFFGKLYSTIDVIKEDGNYTYEIDYRVYKFDDKIQKYVIENDKVQYNNFPEAYIHFHNLNLITLNYENISFNHKELRTKLQEQYLNNKDSDVSIFIKIMTPNNEINCELTLGDRKRCTYYLYCKYYMGDGFKVELPNIYKIIDYLNSLCYGDSVVFISDNINDILSLNNLNKIYENE